VCNYIQWLDTHSHSNFLSIFQSLFLYYFVLNFYFIINLFFVLSIVIVTICTLQKWLFRHAHTHTHVFVDEICSSIVPNFFTISDINSSKSLFCRRRSHLFNIYCLCFCLKKFQLWFQCHWVLRRIFEQNFEFRLDFLSYLWKNSIALHMCIH
jgi:hypothetical protein